MRRTVTFRQDQFDILQKHLLSEDGKEHVAFLLFGRSEIDKDPWTGDKELRLLCKDIDLVLDSDLLENYGDHITWDNNRFLPILSKAEVKNFSVGIIHSHPGGFNSFSIVDNENEKALFQMAFNRNGTANDHASFIMTPPGKIIGRVWEPTLECPDIAFIRVLGDRYNFFFKRDNVFSSPEFLHRQKLAFGDGLIEEFSKLRIGIVGCGATGTATAILLARLGIGKLLLIDKDVVEVSNLNRLHGITSADAGSPKVKALRNNIENIGLGTQVYSINDWVSSFAVRDALKSCDIIFGCSDDHAGRMFLNRFAYFYLVPLIDMGLTIHMSSSTPPNIQALIGRVTVVSPGLRCLNSYNITNAEIAYAENMRRSDPEQYKQLKKEAYVVGEGNPSPAVGTFTTETATMAVNELIHRIQGYRSTGPVNHRLRFFHMDEDIKPINQIESDCRICGNPSYWGRGDMEPFLDMV